MILERKKKKIVVKRERVREREKVYNPTKNKKKIKKISHCFARRSDRVIILIDKVKALHCEQKSKIVILKKRNRDIENTKTKRYLPAWLS